MRSIINRITLLIPLLLALPPLAQADTPVPATAGRRVANESFPGSPKKFTRRGDKIQEGAVYRPDGQVVCILRRTKGAKSDPGAFIYAGNPALDRLAADESAVSGVPHPGDNLCEKIAQSSVKLALGNGDLLNRLQWSAAEGNCSLVIPGRTQLLKNGAVKALDAAVAPDPEHPTATYLHGYIMENLSKKYGSEREMLQRACNSGVGHDYYRPYFIDASAQHAAPLFHLIANPYGWKPASVEEAFEGNELDQRIGHCMKDLFPSVMPGPAADPGKATTEGFAFWSHSPRGCNADALAARIRLGKVGKIYTETYCCFKKHP